MLDAQNASVCPSDEDSQTFYVNASNGDSFRLKGSVCRLALCITHDGDAVIILIVVILI